MSRALARHPEPPSGVSQTDAFKRYNDDDAGAKAAAPSIEPEPLAPTQDLSQVAHDDIFPAPGQNGESEDQVYHGQDEDDDDDVDFNLGGDNEASYDAGPKQETIAPSGPVSKVGGKEDG